MEKDRVGYVSMKKPWMRRRCGANIAYLKFLYCDLDIWHDEDTETAKMSGDEVLGKLYSEVFGKVLPRPTFVNFTGRGFLVGWKICRSEKDKGELYNNALGRKRWVRMQKVFTDALKEYAADPMCASDIARLFRVPGTINGRSKSLVTTIRMEHRVYGMKELEKKYLDGKNTILLSARQEKVLENMKKAGIDVPEDTFEKYEDVYHFIGEAMPKLYEYGESRRLKASTERMIYRAEYLAAREYRELPEGYKEDVGVCMKFITTYEKKGRSASFIDCWDKELAGRNVMAIRMIENYVKANASRKSHETIEWIYRICHYGIYHDHDLAEAAVEKLNMMFDCPSTDDYLTSTATAETRYDEYRELVCAKLKDETGLSWDEMQEKYYHRQTLDKKAKSEYNRNHYLACLRMKGESLCKDKIRQRRIRVEKYLEEGKCAKEIAVIEQVTKRTILNDIRALKEGLSGTEESYPGPKKPAYDDCQKTNDLPENNNISFREKISSEEDINQGEALGSREDDGNNWKSEEIQEEMQDDSMEETEKRSKEKRFEETLSSIVNEIRMGNNVYLHGHAGSGKTTLIRRLIEKLGPAYAGRIIHVAPSGTAAQQIEGGSTLHHAFGLKARTYGIDEVPKIRPMPGVASLYSARLVIVDEAAMLRFDLFSAMMGLICQAEMSCGYRIPVVLVGDSWQIRPVMTEKDRRHLYHKWNMDFGDGRIECCDAFHFLNPAHYELAGSFRMEKQNDKEICRLVGEKDPSALLWLHRMSDRGKCRYYDENAIHLCPYRIQAEDINRTIIRRNIKEGAVYRTYEADYISEGATGDDFDVPMKQDLYVGMPVCLTMNTKKYFNGTIGTITKLYQKSVEVTTQDGKRLFVHPEVIYEKDLDVEETADGREEIKRMIALPVQPAYAISIHKSQGMTIKKDIVIHCGMFDEGMLYTALTRATDLSRVCIAGEISKEEFLYPCEWGKRRFLRKQEAA